MAPNENDGVTFSALEAFVAPNEDAGVSFSELRAFMAPNENSDFAFSESGIAFEAPNETDVDEAGASLDLKSPEPAVTGTVCGTAPNIEADVDFSGECTFPKENPGLTGSDVSSLSFTFVGETTLGAITVFF